MSNIKTVGLLIAAAIMLTFCSKIQAQQTVTISEGIEVKVKLVENLSSKNAVEGQKFNLDLDQEIRVNNQIVIPRGTKALGTVVTANKKGFMGKAGELNIKINYLLVGDQRVSLRATTASEGKSKVGTTVALTVLFGPIGLLKRGKDIEINSGTIFTAYIDQTTQITALQNTNSPAVETISAPEPVSTTVPTSTPEPTSTPAAAAPADVLPVK
jgi:hypothetical protein